MNKVYLVFLAIGLLVSGCTSISSIPESLDEENSLDQTRVDMGARWREDIPDLTYIPVDSEITVSAPNVFPDEIANIKVDIEFNQEGKVSDLAAILEQFNINLVIPDPDLAKKQMALFRFKGRLGDFINALASAYKISFTMQPGRIMVAEANSFFMIRLPQDETLIDLVSSNIASLGAEEINTSHVAGVITYESTYQKHQRIMDFLNIIRVNASVITLQVAVLSVAMDKQVSEGIDYGQLQMTLNGGIAEAVTSVVNPVDTVTDTAETVVESVTGTITGDGTTLKTVSGDFGLTAVFNYLSTFGKTETVQSVLLKTLSNRETGIQSGQQVPYIEKIGISASTDGTVSGNSLGSAEIKTIDTGLTLKIKPVYDHNSNTVSMSVDLDLNTLLSFTELSAGNQIGKITRPNTQQQKFNNYIRITSGETALIGGINFDSVSDNKAAPSFLDHLPLVSRGLKLSRNSLFILIRPTITIFGMPEQE